MKQQTAIAKLRKKGNARAIAFALLMHGALIALLIIGVNWKTKTPQAVQVELFTPSAPQAEPEPKPALPEPEPAKPPPQPIVQPPAADTAAADLALEQAKKKVAEKARETEKKEAKKLREQEDREAALEQAEQAKKDKEKASNKEKLEREKLAKNEKKLVDEKKLAEKNKADQDKEDQQQKMIQALQKQAGAATGAPVGAKTGVTDPDYSGRVSAAIRRNTVYAANDDSENPIATFTVSLTPDCSVRNVDKVKGSGSSAWDEAAARAIRRTDPFPKPRDGNCPNAVTIKQSPKER
jgi:colicin import membrane protein